MKPEQKSLRFGAVILLFAVILRLFGGGLTARIGAVLQSPDFAAFMLSGGTGRFFSVPEGAPEPSAPAPTAPTAPVPSEPPVTQPAVPAFAPEDSTDIELKNHPGYAVDVAAMLQEPLLWDLTGDKPTVLIIHSHTSESYENTEGYIPSDFYRTLDQRYNIVSVGKHLAQALEEKGITVIHDTTVHDYPSYNNAYPLSRITVEGYLEKYPSICLVLDIHRDAYENAGGEQISNTLSVNGKTAAKLMLVAGTDANNQIHTQWQENLSVAVKLQAILQQQYPGLCRPLTLRSSAFNQDLCPGALLIEIGTAGDTRDAALYAAELLADGIAALAWGANISPA